MGAQRAKKAYAWVHDPSNKKTIEEVSAAERELIGGIEKLQELQGSELRQEMEDLVEPVKMARKAAGNLIRQIEKSKESLARLVYAIGIRFVGERTAQLLAEHFGSLEKFREATPDDFYEVEEIGPKVAQSIVDFFREKRNSDVIEKLAQAGLRIEEEKSRKGGELSGRNAICSDRHSAALASRRGNRHDRSGRRARYWVRQQEDELRGGGRGSRIQACKGAGARDYDLE